MSSKEIAKHVTEWVHPTPLLLRLIQTLLTALIILPTLVCIRQCLISYAAEYKLHVIYYLKLYLGTSIWQWDHLGSCRDDITNSSCDRPS